MDVRVGGDFLLSGDDATLWDTAQYSLLDPSCSGSGIVSRIDDVLLNEEDALNDQDEPPNHESGGGLQDRLKQLSQFQVTALCHALSFPKVASSGLSKMRWPLMWLTPCHRCSGSCTVRAQYTWQRMRRSLRRRCGAVQTLRW